MPVVWFPAQLRELVGGQQSLSIEGATVRQVIDNLERRYPGLHARLCEGDQLRSSIAVVIDGRTSTLKLRQRLEETSEVHFVFSISGGNG